ncbi:MAG TPA: 7-carboxy-7-deazaguanine synthase [Solirubrobacteraceae bacterium]
MTYTVKEIFFTLQGEGANAGRPAVLCRFAGCNLWNGREADRSTAICRFCDTDFRGTNGPRGARYGSPTALADAIEAAWPDPESPPFVVLTGGEPALQIDTKLLEELGRRGFERAVETNGTLDLPLGLDWVCVSPKAGTVLRVKAGDELKVVHPQPELDLAALAALDFRWRFVQPMDGPDAAAHLRACVEHCLANPSWRLSLQTHKLLGIP